MEDEEIKYPIKTNVRVELLATHDCSERRSMFCGGYYEINSTGDLNESFRRFAELGLLEYDPNH
jgi:hypothetical protein